MNLNSLAFFDERRVARLNDLVAVNKHLMPHVVASGIGCSLKDAMIFLVFLFLEKKAEGYLLIYHVKHQDFYFDRKLLKDGLPKEEHFCQVCEENVLESELLYDFEFVLTQDTEFKI